MLELQLISLAAMLGIIAVMAVVATLGKLHRNLKQVSIWMAKPR